MVRCILCQTTMTKDLGNIQDIVYHQCNNCHIIFKSTDYFLDAATERDRYLLHNNDVNDPNYQKFVDPIIQAVLRNFDTNSKGLDYGAGTAPVITDMLLKKGFDIKKYDPFFHPDTSVLSKYFDFIVCCEVVEHFHNPSREFELLYRLLKPNGMIFCMTELRPDLNKFSEWYYKNDPTHVIFYSEKSMHWIKANYGFSEVEIFGRLSILKK